MFEPSSEQKPVDRTQLWAMPTADDTPVRHALAEAEAAEKSAGALGVDEYFARQKALEAVHHAKTQAAQTDAVYHAAMDKAMAAQKHNEPIEAQIRAEEERKTASVMAGAASLATTAALWGGLADAAPSAADAFGKTVEPHAMGMPIAIPLASVFTAIAAHPDKLAELMPAPTTAASATPQNQATIAFPTGDVQPAPAPVMDEQYAEQQSATAPATVPTNNGMQADGSLAEGQSTLPAPVRRPTLQHNPTYTLADGPRPPKWARHKGDSGSGNA